MKANSSTLFYLQTNKQSRIANEEIKSYFCFFVNYEQDNWIEKLAIAQFSANKNNLAFIKLSLFFAIKSCIPAWALI